MKETLKELWLGLRKTEHLSRCLHVFVFVWAHPEALTPNLTRLGTGASVLKQTLCPSSEELRIKAPVAGSVLPCHPAAPLSPGPGVCPGSGPDSAVMERVICWSGRSDRRE